MFDNKKVLQMVSYLLSLNGNKMDKLKLIKELYLIDRMSIDEDNSSISGDNFFSMKYGPVLSMTLNIINDIPNDNSWSEYLKLEDNKSLILIKPFDELLDMPLSLYKLQLSAYQSCIDKIGIKTVGRRIIWMLPTGDYEKIRIEHYVPVLRDALTKIIKENHGKYNK